jgi:hypothetical protein
VKLIWDLMMPILDILCGCGCGGWGATLVHENEKPVFGFERI